MVRPIQVAISMKNKLCRIELHHIELHHIDTKGLSVIKGCVDIKLKMFSYLHYYFKTKVQKYTLFDGMLYSKIHYLTTYSCKIMGSDD